MGVIDTLTGNMTYLILLVLLMIYIPIYFHVRSSKRMAEKGIVPYGPTIMLKTKRGMRLLDRLARHRRFWGIFGTISKIMAFFLMAVMVFILVNNLLLLPLMAETSGIGVEYALAIPGLNPMLPLVYGVIGLVVAVAIHEIAHGVQTRANDMDVESMGILYAVVPIGAFVEPNNEQIMKATRKARSSMYAAGIAVNLTVAAVLFLVMSAGMMGSMSSNVGGNAAVVNISADSPADDANIGYSSIILGIQEGMVLTDLNYNKLMGHEFLLDSKYDIRYATANGPDNIANMYMGVFINGIAKGSPAEKAGIPKNSFLVSIDGNPVKSMNEFARIMTSLNLQGKTVDVVYQEYNGGVLSALKTKTVTLGENNGRAYLGVNYSLSGLTFTTPDAVLAMAKNPFHNSETVSEAASDALRYIGSPFRGNSPIPQEFTWWYQSSVLPDDVFWVVLQATFWIFWLNLVLAITNAIPAVPFDGGFLLRDGVGSAVDRTHKHASQEQRDRITDSVTRTVSYVTLFLLLLVMVMILF